MPDLDRTLTRVQVIDEPLDFKGLELRDIDLPRGRLLRVMLVSFLSQRTLRDNTYHPVSGEGLAEPRRARNQDGAVKFPRFRAGSDLDVGEQVRPEQAKASGKHSKHGRDHDHPPFEGGQYRETDVP